MEMLGKWLQKRRQPALDPDRAARVLREFDEARGYREYHEYCRKRFARIPSPAFGDLGCALDDPGFEYLDVMPPGLAADLLSELESRFQVSSVKKDRPELSGFAIDDPGFRARLLTAALPEPVDRRIVDHFESEYRVYWFSVTRTGIGGGTASFLWHRDRGPTRHLKLLVYLNGDAVHGGRTEFIDSEASRALAKIGYPFGPTRHRKDDLSELLGREGLRYDPESRAMTPGQGILFPPALTSHRGRSPTRGARDVLTLCLLPGPLPWRETLEKSGVIDLRRDEKWHRHASELI